MEVLGFMLGTALSPRINAAGGNYANYVAHLALVSACLAYLTLFIKESKPLSASREEARKRGVRGNMGEFVLAFINANHLFQKLSKSLHCV